MHILLWVNRVMYKVRPYVFDTAHIAHTKGKLSELKERKHMDDIILAVIPLEKPWKHIQS